MTLYLKSMVFLKYASLNQQYPEQLEIIMRYYLILPFILASLFISGCSSVPTASNKSDAQAKNAQVAADQANIYVYQAEPFSSTSGFEVSLNGQATTKLAANTYHLWTVKPGEYEMVSLTRNNAKLKLKIEAGKNYYINQKVDVGIWVSRSQLHEVSEKEGKKALATCKLVAQP